MASASSDNENFRARAQALFGSDLTGPTAMHEVLRCELSARKVASGRSLCERARSLLQPLASLDLGRIREILEELADSGDATWGPSGMFAAAPLRVVRLSASRYAIHGTTPTPHLRRSLPCETLEAGVTRQITVATDRPSTLEDDVIRLGGLVLSPERWAGLDRVPPANSEWLEEMNHRLDQNRSLAGALDEGLITPWQRYGPILAGAPRQRWRSAEAKEVQPNLWRARHEYGWWRFAWTAGGSPGSSPHASLTQDEACRTQFALDREANNPLQAALKKGTDGVEVEIDAFLPRAEYRYLTTLGKRLETSGLPRYLVALTVWNETAATLQARLGLHFAEGRPPR